MPVLEDIRILLVIAPEDFSERELLALQETFGREGAQMAVVNGTGQPGRGMYGAVVNPQSNFYDIDSRDFDAIIFIGGPGAAVYSHNRRALQLAREFNAAGKPVAALDVAPSILANADILHGRRATARPTERNIINVMGTYTGAPVEVDGNIITASSSVNAAELAAAVIAALRKR